MNRPEASRRRIVLHAARDALAPRTSEMLDRLGYDIVASDQLDTRFESDPDFAPDLLLIDERRLAEAEAYEDGGRSLPIVLLCGATGATGADARVVGAVKRPAGLHELYRLVQRLFEDRPRSTPRVDTQLAARLARGDQIWDGRVLSISENGCLVRSSEAIPLGQTIRLEFELPNLGDVSIDAEASYQVLPDTGFVFSRLSAVDRDSLIRFVTKALLAT